MKTGTGLAVGALLACITAAGGYWLGRQAQTSSMGESKAAAPAAQSVNPERRILFYRNPMGLPDTSPTPKKDPMGMDYVPVYEGEGGDSPASANLIKISTEKIQRLGVRTDPVSRRPIDKVIRAAGRIVPDERRIYAISPKFEGYVERLHVNVTGQPVAQGEPLFEVYSPDMVSAQGEYAVAARGLSDARSGPESARRDLQQVVDASVLRLKNWDIPDDEIKALEQTGQIRRTFTFRSPVSGVVTEKKALQGQRFMAGETLYQVTDLSSVWVIADVFEQDIAAVKIGARARVRLAAYPDRSFNGTITYLYPTLTAETRTVPVRIELPNPGQMLKPAMFAQIEIPVATKSSELVVPTSAVIDSGTRRIVLVQVAEGRFEPREVKLGQRGEDVVQVLDGVGEGERVVTAANFLIDAESNLKAAIGGFAAAAGGAATGTPASGHGIDQAGQASLQPGAVGHRGRGTIEELDAAAGMVSIGHGPIEALKMPAMTMEFRVANASLLNDLKRGATVDFEFVERNPGEWVVTRIGPAGADAAAAQAPTGANSHR